MAGNKWVFLREAKLVGQAGGNENRGFVQFGDGSENQIDQNPYTKRKLRAEQDNAYIGKITSIPSPYARMHITDLAFYEYNCGGELSEDYKRAMSHCLDIFELIFHSHELELREKGITLQRINLYHGRDDRLAGLRQCTKTFLNTLELYRNQYLYAIGKIIRDNGISYHFDFKSLYVLRCNGRVFAATSPFTGFFSKADCDLKDANITLPGQRRRFLTGDNSQGDWQLLNQRDPEFKKFMYSLLVKTRLQYVFVDMFTALEREMRTIDPNYENNFGEAYFDEHYPQFNIGNDDKLQEISRLNGVYIRPDGLDCSYLKYLLYVEKSIDLSIDRTAYDSEIETRQFPDGSGNLSKWIGPNDILSDALVILPYEINDNYMAAQYTDSLDGNNKRRCLYPIKPFWTGRQTEYSDFYSFWKDLENGEHRLEIERRGGSDRPLSEINEEEDVFFVAKLYVKLSNGGTTVLRREYRLPNAKNRNATDGVLVMAYKEKPMTLAFGLYPFVRTKKYDNIYKVLFYNNFSKDIDYDLTFYQVNNENGNLERLPDATNVIKNKTSNSKQNKLNCNYYSLKCEKNQLQFIELSLKKSEDNDKKDDKKGLTSLIVPNIREYKSNGHSVSVAIDLGTSNTYVAYYDQDQKKVERINTHHVDKDENGAVIGKDWNELTFLNSKCNINSIPKEIYSPIREQYCENLYLPNNGKLEDVCLKPQLLEFIPSWISTRNEEQPSKDKAAYLFPIPTVINSLRLNSERNSDIEYDDNNKEFASTFPLVKASIPFAYYDMGKRDVDNIVNGNEFKWFTKKLNGRYDDNTSDSKKNKASLYLFVNELLYIVRSHLLCSNYDLKNLILIWSYPLSFDSKLKEGYEKAWKSAYETMVDENSNGKIICTNESCTPIFAIQKGGLPNNRVILVDIGGGSSDVIGYQKQEPYFITSFAFAGNSLYCEGELNKGGVLKPDANYFVKKAREIIGDKIKINDDSASVMMNYGFSKMADKFTDIFRDDFPSYLRLFHNAALFYHIAQLCKIEAAECPDEIYLSGNGSKLLYVNNEWRYDSIIKNIFKHVYGDVNVKIDIIPAPNPKAATAEGALVGQGLPGVSISDDSVDANKVKVVMLGDCDTCFNFKESGKGVKADNDQLKYENYKDKILKNVEDFIEMFYSEDFAQYHQNIVKKEDVKWYLNDSMNDDRMKLDGDISQSLFFQCISIIMEQIMYKNRNIYE